LPGREASGGGELLAFDQDAALETGSGADQGDQMGRVDHAPARSCADSMSLNVIASAAVRDPAPRVTLVRSRTVANVDSIGLVVRRWIQCSAG